MTKKLSINKRYIIADKLAIAFKPVVGKSFCSLSKRVQFGIILNQQFSSKGTVMCLNDKYEFEIASHITNLIIRRLCSSNAIVEVDL